MTTYQDAIGSSLQTDMSEAWRTYIEALHKSLESLENELDQAIEMTNICTDEWCIATEHYLDELSNAVFTIHEPRWTTKEDSDKIRELKRRIRNLYVKHTTAIGKKK